MKETARRVVSRFVVAGRVAALGRKMFPKQGALILFGHRVRDDDEGMLQGLKPEWFREQLEYLVRHYEMISLSRLLEYFEKGEIPPQNSAVLTFDDGFRDNYDNAFPVLLEMRVPATVFLVTGSIETGELPWPQRLAYMLQHTEVEAASLPGSPGPSYRLGSREDRYRAFVEFSCVLEKQGRVARTRILDKLSVKWKVSPPLDRMLSWNDAREMQASGLVEFGAHTFSHPWMEYLSEEDARCEMERSKTDLREQLGIEKPPFCFPGGSRSPKLVAMAKELGFRSVFQSRQGLRYNSPLTTDQFALSRVGLPNAPAYILEAELDGPFHAIRSCYRRKG